jgi:acyl dehydratase
VSELGSTGYDIAVGTYEDALAMIGTTTPVRFGEVPVNVGMVRYFAAMVHDANAGFWDEDFAAGEWGGCISPPGFHSMGMTHVISMAGGALPVPLLTARVPLPGSTFVNASNDTEFFRPIRVGDVLNVTEELVDVSAKKRTVLGEGHFVTTASTFRRQDGTTVARMTNVLFRFDPEAA